jgi:hypothetical protein
MIVVVRSFRRVVRVVVVLGQIAAGGPVLQVLGVNFG